MRASYTLTDDDAAKMRDGLATVTAMRVGMSYVIPAVGLALGCSCVFLLHLTKAARATTAAAKLVAAPRPGPTVIEAAATLALAVEAGAAGGVCERE